MGFLQSIWDNIYQTLIYDDRWKFYAEGLGNTLFITLLAAVIGVAIGVLVAIVKTWNTTTGRLKPLAWLCSLYTTVIRGTPVMVQLLIIYFVIFAAAPKEMKLPIAALAFGINSGAYVAEIIRAGIQSVDVGQTEAGRSLGLKAGQTMRLIVLPQAVKNILPALFNEVIALLKETSVAGFISILDITRAGDLIRSRTLAPMALYVSAALYLALVVGLTQLQKLIEKRMRASD